MGDEVTVTPVTPSNSYRAKGPKSALLVRLMIFFSHVHAAQKVLQVYCRVRLQDSQQGPTKTPTFRCERPPNSFVGGVNLESRLVALHLHLKSGHLDPFRVDFAANIPGKSHVRPSKLTCHPNPPVKLEHFGWKLPPNQGRACILSNINNYTEYMIIVYTYSSGFQAYRKQQLTVTNYCNYWLIK